MPLAILKPRFRVEEAATWLEPKEKHLGIEHRRAVKDRISQGSRAHLWSLGFVKLLGLQIHPPA
jgi:hypothetical protein